MKILINGVVAHETGNLCGRLMATSDFFAGSFLGICDGCGILLNIISDCALKSKRFL